MRAYLKLEGTEHTRADIEREVKEPPKRRRRPSFSGDKRKLGSALGKDDLGDEEGDLEERYMAVMVAKLSDNQEERRRQLETGTFDTRIYRHTQLQTHHRSATEMDYGWMDREVGEAVEDGAREIMAALNGNPSRPVIRRRSRGIVGDGTRLRVLGVH